MRRIGLPLLVASLAFIACSSGIDYGAGANGIRGRVTIGPQCPVEMANSPCPDAPFVATIIVRDAVGDVVSTSRTADDGRFQIRLPPGTYRVEASPVQEGGIARMLPVDPITVRTGEYTTVPISFDSGIR